MDERREEELLEIMKGMRRDLSDASAYWHRTFEVTMLQITSRFNDSIVELGDRIEAGERRLEDRIDKLGDRIDKVGDRIDRQGRVFTMALHTEVNELKYRIDRTNERLDQTNERLDQTNERLVDLRAELKAESHATRAAVQSTIELLLRPPTDSTDSTD